MGHSCRAPKFSGLHNAHKATDPVDLLAVRLTEFLKTSNQVFCGLTFCLNLAFDLFEESVEFRVDFKQ